MKRRVLLEESWDAFLFHVVHTGCQHQSSAHLMGLVSFQVIAWFHLQKQLSSFWCGDIRRGSFRIKPVTTSMERDELKAPQILHFVEFSKTRFLGALLMGSRVVFNWPVIEEVNSHALFAEDDPWPKWPGLKERHISEWDDISTVTRDFVPVLEHLSGEYYPTLAGLCGSIQLLRA